MLLFGVYLWLLVVGFENNYMNLNIFYILIKLNIIYFIQIYFNLVIKL